MNTLPHKLQVQLDKLRQNHGMLPWSQACKKHRQLEALGLVTKGHAGADAYAVLVTDAVKAELQREASDDVQP